MQGGRTGNYILVVYNPRRSSQSYRCVSTNFPSISLAIYSRLPSLRYTTGKCTDCCKTCCHSTPFGTIAALSVTVVGLVGFLSSSIYGVLMVEASDDYENQ